MLALSTQCLTKSVALSASACQVSCTECRVHLSAKDLLRTEC